MTISTLITEAHATAVDKGWWAQESFMIVCPCTTLVNLDQLSRLDTDPNCGKCQGKGVVATHTERSFGDCIALMHSELSEALEEFRTGESLDSIYGLSAMDTLDHRVDPAIITSAKPCGIAVEFADVLIRIFDTCGRYNIPLEEALRLKMAYNKTRPHRHGGKSL